MGQAQSGETSGASHRSTSAAGRRISGGDNSSAGNDSPATDSVNNRRRPSVSRRHSEPRLVLGREYEEEQQNSDNSGGGLISGASHGGGGPNINNPFRRSTSGHSHHLPEISTAADVAASDGTVSGVDGTAAASSTSTSRPSVKSFHNFRLSLRRLGPDHAAGTAVDGGDQDEDGGDNSSSNVRRSSLLRFRRGGGTSRRRVNEDADEDADDADGAGNSDDGEQRNTSGGAPRLRRGSASRHDTPPSLVSFGSADLDDVEETPAVNPSQRRPNAPRSGQRKSSSQRRASDNAMVASAESLPIAEDEQQQGTVPSPHSPATPGRATAVPAGGSSSSSTIPTRVYTVPSTPRFSSPNTANNNSPTVTFEVTTPERDGAASHHYTYRTNSSGYAEDAGSTVSDMENDDDGFSTSHFDFYPTYSRSYEWMGRSVESLVLGHQSPAPLLALLDESEGYGDESMMTSEIYTTRRRSTASTFGGGRRRSSQGSFPGTRRGSLSLSVGSESQVHGGTLASYYSRGRHRGGMPTDVDRSYSTDRQGGRRGSITMTGPMYRRRSSMASTPSVEVGQDGAVRNKDGGPNIAFSVMAREMTGKSWFGGGLPTAKCLREMGGNTMFLALDKPAAGIATEVSFLAAALDIGDLAETHAIVSRLAPRLIGDPMQPPGEAARRSAIEDPTLPPTAPKFYAGGGRLGLERDAFVKAGGVDVLIRVFREKSIVGQEMAESYDARDLSEEIVVSRLAQCWNESLACLRELVYAIPNLVEDGAVSDQGNFLPFLFTLLSHDSCFDGAAALIEEILSFLSQSPQQVSQDGMGEQPFQPTGRTSPATTFFLGNVPSLYKLWRGFSCRHLAHFCRILALLVFEPEDRQLLESPAVLKSLELLQLRRNRAVRAGKDSTVDMNQAILLGDDVLISRLLNLLKVMNFAPPLRRFSSYHVMASFPFIADTLVMLGLSELDDWDEVCRQEALARKLLLEEREDQSEPLLTDLGAVAGMLESLASTLMGNQREPANQLGHILHVISAAQQAGVIVGRSRRGRRGNQTGSGHAANRSVSEDNRRPDDATSAAGLGGIPGMDSPAMQGLASVAGIWTDQVLVRRLYQSAGQDVGDNPSGAGGGGGRGPSPDVADERRDTPRHLINTPEDAANSLQFNAMLLGPYQVEVLFVLCTLLGGRRKLDAQDMMKEFGTVSVLEDMFQRLPWHKQQNRGGDSDENGAGSESMDQPQTNGIHGPDCTCTPESALCVQYLRLLHNFCDRDCDNYSGRRLLLSDSERQCIFGGPNHGSSEMKPGLLSKIITAFIQESDESPYRFWLASCIESYLRGSSPGEQLFAAQKGLLDHLVEDISSDRLHCAGSLQTSFDLLGELGKGNSEVVQLLVNNLDEASFRKLMSVAAANLVDSNVFIRSLLLSLERLSAADRLVSLYLDVGLCDLNNQIDWSSQTGRGSRSYLTHSWWDAEPISLLDEIADEDEAVEEVGSDESRRSDWFPPLDVVLVEGVRVPEGAMLPAGLEASVGHFGWVFSPAGDSLAANTYLPNTVERMSWFLAANQARLLRDLLGVVDLRNINHENICCLNTAVVIAIFAHRRRQLSALLQELRQMSDEERESNRRARDAGRQDDDIVDRAFVQAMRYLDLEYQRETPAYARRASMTGGSPQEIGDRSDVMRNFREVLWFWMEYYTHRGRDRLSLEFSSHIRFQEWSHVVSLLSADDGSSTSLVRTPVRLPLSPYQRAARVPFGRLETH